MPSGLFYAAALGGTLIVLPALAQSDNFVTHQAMDQWRASKLVGVSVMGTDQKKIGKIEDVLVNHEGDAQTVVIEVGGFLGIGAKDVAVPFNTLKWQTEGRAVAETTPMTATPAATNNGAPAIVRTDSAAAEASRGYPDMAMLDMTKDQLKNAPEFHYAAASTTTDKEMHTAPPPIAPAPAMAPAPAVVPAPSAAPAAPITPKQD